jgi:hypothetical protein
MIERSIYRNRAASSQPIGIALVQRVISCASPTADLDKHQLRRYPQRFLEKAFGKRCNARLRNCMAQVMQRSDSNGGRRMRPNSSSIALVV